MAFATVSSKGQITLPAALRQSLGIQLHDRVAIERKNGMIVVTRVPGLFEFEGFLEKTFTPEEERARTIQAVAQRADEAGR